MVQIGGEVLKFSGVNFTFCGMVNCPPLTVTPSIRVSPHWPSSYNVIRYVSGGDIGDRPVAIGRKLRPNIGCRYWIPESFYSDRREPPCCY